jgi:hypothetical protein
MHLTAKHHADTRTPLRGATSNDAIVMPVGEPPTK